MVYKKHIWQTGEVIASDKLNNIETNLQNIIIGTPFYVDAYLYDINTIHLNKTVSQLKEAIKNKQIIYFSEPKEEDQTLQSDYWPASDVSIVFDDRHWTFTIHIHGNFTELNSWTFESNSENEEPVVYIINGGIK